MKFLIFWFLILAFIRESLSAGKEIIADINCNSNYLSSYLIQNELKCIQLAKCSFCKRMKYNTTIQTCELNDCPRNFTTEYSINFSNFKAIFRDSTIQSENVTNLGTWRNFDFCPEKSYAIGFSVRILEYQVTWDDSMMEGLTLICNDYLTTRILSYEGLWGDWSTDIFCPNGTGLNGFTLKAEPLNTEASYDSYLGMYDNTAANGIKMFCQGQSEPLVPSLEGIWGNWSRSIFCEDGKLICGISVQFQENQGKGVFLDDTGLNNVKFKCCKP